MATVKMAPNGLGGTIYGNYGTYTAGSDGLFTVDTRDAPQMLAIGMSYVFQRNTNYTTPKAPAAAASGQIVASTALSNGALTIANQPDCPRPAQIVLGTGTGPVTAGIVQLIYTANDGTTTTDNISAILGASATKTAFTSKGVQKLATGVVSGISGGTSPFIHVDTIAAISVPVDAGAVDFAVYNELVDGTAETVGSLFTNSIGSITPTTAPNATHTYSFAYTQTSPTS